ncbi:hypothetical protein A6A04_21145 [Paramagnetospirillum marisnigri]|uniref:Uncharacterized protein n=1 Tax=Paramagnetospirillum marisnigri TaxID=1285242 RepID=A0A178M5J1_9PROT|nr:hypothetical protein A6A04_21145 [Paramagnetospirillum marisnigri]
MNPVFARQIFFLNISFLGLGQSIMAAKNLNWLKMLFSVIFNSHRVTGYEVVISVSPSPLRGIFANNIIKVIFQKLIKSRLVNPSVPYFLGAAT